MKGFDAAANCTFHAPRLAERGMKFACRYYRRKVENPYSITPYEAAQLCHFGMSIVSVFQNTSDKPEYFREANALEDAGWALKKADQMRQPTGTAIYFAVDCNPRSDDGNPLTPDVSDVLDYFGVVRDAFMHSGYTIGVYGSGLVCKAVRDASIAQHAWLTNAVGWYGTREFDDWAIRQGREIKQYLPGLDIDPDEATNPTDAGMWRYA